MKNRFWLAASIALLLCIIAWTVNAQIGRNPAARQTWEYRSFGINGAYWEENGRQLPGNPAALLPTKMNELGEQGWELVAVSDRENIATYWFKRAK